MINDDELKAALAAAKAKRDAAAAEDAAFDEAEALPNEVARLEQEAKDTAAWTDAKKQYGSKRVAMVKTESGAVIVKVPNEILFKAWQDSQDAKASQSLESLATPCIVYPDPKKDAARLDKILSDWPATMGRLADACTVLAGWRRDDLSKKS